MLRGALPSVVTAHSTTIAKMANGTGLSAREYVCEKLAVWTGAEHFPRWSLESKYGPSLMNTGDTGFREAVKECVHAKLTFQRLKS